MNLLLNTLIFIIIYIVLTVSFDLVLGYAGLFSVAHAAFFAIGAYATALLALHAGMPIELAALIGAAICAAFSAILALMSMRVGEDYLVIASFGFLSVVLATFSNIPAFGGMVGIGNIPGPSLFGPGVVGAGEYAILFGIVAALIVGVVWVLANSPFGRALKAIRENEVAAEALGKSSARFKTYAFTIAGAMGGIAGAMYASYISYISPVAFGFDVNNLIFAMVILGGAGTVFGPLLGSALLVTLPTVLSLMTLPPGWVGPVEQTGYGLLLVAFAMWRPNGLYGLLRYLAPRRILRPRQVETGRAS